MWRHMTTMTCAECSGTFFHYCPRSFIKSLTQPIAHLVFTCWVNKGNVLKEFRWSCKRGAVDVKVIKVSLLMHQADTKSIRKEHHCNQTDSVGLHSFTWSICKAVNWTKRRYRCMWLYINKSNRTRLSKGLTDGIHCINT